MEAHDEKVAAIATTIRRFHAEGRKFRIYHGSTNSTRAGGLKRDGVIDTSGLDRVLHVDHAKQTALVEPNVPMDELVAALARQGHMPPVVMEFPGITVGGGFSGTSGESSSFKHGLFEQTVCSIEIVLANGDVVHASKHAHADLFYGAAGAFGTLGVVTLLELELLPARKYVELTYVPFPSAAEAISEISRVLHSDEESSRHDFVDGIIFSRTQATVMLGRLTDTPGPATKPLQTFDRASDPWFYLHAQSASFPARAATSAASTDIIPTASYFFRYDRGAFWAARHAFTYFLVPFNGLTRYLLDPLLHTRTIYRAMHRSTLASQYIVQDVVLPLSTAPAFVEHVTSRLGIHPLWLCPLRKRRPGRKDHSHLSAIHDPEGDAQAFVLNVGVWGGRRQGDYAAFLAANRALEAEISALGGVKTLYAQAFYPEEEFGRLYDVERWEALRRKYGAEGLPSVWDKVVTKDRPEELDWRRRAKGYWPVGGVYGVLCLALGDKGIFERERSVLLDVLLMLVAVGAGMYAIRNYAWS